MQLVGTTWAGSTRLPIRRAVLVGIILQAYWDIQVEEASRWACVAEPGSTNEEGNTDAIGLGSAWAVGRL